MGFWPYLSIAHLVEGGVQSFLKEISESLKVTAFSFFNKSISINQLPFRSPIFRETRVEVAGSRVFNFHDQENLFTLILYAAIMLLRCITFLSNIMIPVL